jgi:hypothetical protein
VVVRADCIHTGELTPDHVIHSDAAKVGVVEVAPRAGSLVASASEATAGCDFIAIRSGERSIGTL